MLITLTLYPKEESKKEGSAGGISQKFVPGRHQSKRGCVLISINNNRSSGTGAFGAGNLEKRRRKSYDPRAGRKSAQIHERGRKISS